MITDLIQVDTTPPTFCEKTSTELQSSEIRYRRLFEAARDGIVLLNAKTALIEDVNPYLLELLAFSRDELIGKALWDIGSFRDSNLNKDMFTELQSTRYVRYDDLPLETKDGRLISVEFVSNVYESCGIDIIQCNIRDNTKRHIIEIALQATTRALKILSESNAALLKKKTEQLLLEEYCRITVETGGYLMSWIGFSVDNPEKSIMQKAHYGDTDNYLLNKKNSWGDDIYGNGPTGRAIRTNEIQVCNNVLSDPSMTIWHEEAMTYNYRSLVALPLQIDQAQTACLTLYGAFENTWSLPELTLLNELADDLVFGIKAIRTAIAKAHHQEQLRISLEQTIQVIAQTIGEKDSYTAGHQRRAAVLASRIGEELGLSKDRIHGLHLAATIHDLGKIGIPAELLVKPSKLSDLEFKLIKEHVNIGYKIIKNVSFPWPIADIMLQHHERLDGSGYPNGITTESILLESKILAVSDVVEAITSHRPYRPALGLKVALKEISKGRGILYDEACVDACICLFTEKGFALPD